MRLTKKKAQALSIMKWEWIVANGGYLGSKEMSKLHEAHPELTKLSHDCGYCEKYMDKNNVTDYYRIINNKKRCGNCPLNLTKTFRTACMQNGHPYLEWLEEQNVKTAQVILDLIKTF